MASELEKLLKQKLPGSPVVNDKEQPIGFLSERDCLIRVMKMKYHNDTSIRVRDFMSPKCFTIGEVSSGPGSHQDLSSQSGWLVRPCSRFMCSSSLVFLTCYFYFFYVA